MTEAWVVTHGIDTLVVNVHHTDDAGNRMKRDLDEALAAQLEDWKRIAQGAGEEYVTPWSFNGARLLMAPNGAMHGQYPWMLKTRDITLYVSTGKWNGIGAVRLSSPFLWSCASLLEAVSKVQVLVDEVFQDQMYQQVSAVDLCADIAGWYGFNQVTKQHFATRARYRRDHSTPDWGPLVPDRGIDAPVEDYAYGLQQTGFSFGIGPKKRGAVCAVIYDKSRQIANSEREWVEDLWRVNGLDELDGPVYRVEVRYKREALHEMWQGVAGEEVLHGIEDVSQLDDLLPLLWSYGVGNQGGGADGLPDGWLRYVVPGSDKNRSRWSTHPVWEMVQGAFSTPGQRPDDFGKVVRKQWQEHNVDKAIEAIMGSLTSLGAWVGEEVIGEGADLSTMLHWFHEAGLEYLERGGRDFVEEVQRKRLRSGLGV